ncbi:MAG: glycosyltransferase family 4 protein [Lachnospiraceae bacterium]|nr:glycosyltransferase family 4 protein [Lachnospiraceae bacterium]
MIGHKLVPSREGGVEIVVWELAKRLRAQGHTVDCYNRSGYHLQAKDYDRIPGKPGVYREGIRMITIPTFRNPKLNAIVYSVLASIRVLFGGYDVIHYHAEGPCLMLWLPKLFGKRVVATIHGLDWQRAKWGNFASSMLKAGEKMAVKYADEVIVLSKNLQEYFKDNYGRETHYIANGIDRPERVSDEIIKERWGIEKDSYVLTLSRLVPEKGIHYLIEAYRGIKTDKKLVITGGSASAEEYREKLAEMAKADPRVMLAGFADAPLVAGLFSNAWIYALPSDIEGMAISLLEAMSYGNCCIVSDIPENMEVVADKAASFKKGDVEDLREKLQNLLDHPELVQRYKDGAADHICSRYNWDSMVENTLPLYYGK